MFGNRRGRAFSSHRGRQNLGLALLMFQIFQYGIDRIPIVTLVTLITNIGIYLQVPQMFEIPLPKVMDICISYKGVVEYREYVRLLLSGFYHLSDMHLYYNMVSFLYKGTQLEPRLGPVRFGSVLTVLLVGSSAVYCALQYTLSLALGPVHLHTCAAGFSCVLFGLKVIMQSNTPPSHRLFGIPIQMAYWSELVWISLISPNVSFVGHLAGIVMGLLITKGPLSFLMTGETPRFFEGGVRNTQTWGTGVASGGQSRGFPTSGGQSRGFPTSGGSGGYPRDPTSGGYPRDPTSGGSGSYPNSGGSGGYPRDPTSGGSGRSNAEYPEEDEEGIQEAIRRSLELEEPRGYTPQEPRGYTPQLPQGNSRLYPDLSPSAPPLEEYNPGPPPPPLPIDVDEIRRRRIQRLQ